MVYPGKDVVLVTFNVTSPDSFENVKEKWLPEVFQLMRNIPHILVGTKSGTCIYICGQRH